MKKVFRVGAVSIVLLIIGCIILWNIRPSPPQLSEYLVTDSTIPVKGELSVQFLGNTNLVFSDGETTIMTDGFFSRPSANKLLLGKVSPNRKIIEKCLQKAGIEHLDAVIPVHSHFDHAMDAPMVADITGAQLIGSSSTINIGKGYGLPESQMTIPPLNEVVQIGKFRLTFIHSRHWQYPDPKQREKLLDQDIKQPIVPPASIYDYKEGISYTILIEHDSTKIAINGTAGFRENVIPKFDADVLFLAIAGLEMMDEAYNQNYQDHLIDAVSPEVLIPIHWDDFTVPLSKGLKTTNLIINQKVGSNMEKAFEKIEQHNLTKR